MADFPYTANAPGIGRLFSQIHSVGKPEKVTQKWIESIGFKGKNDRRLISLLKALKFIADSGAPTERWSAYRDKDQSKAVMAQALREAYTSLFRTFPDAFRKDDEALRNFFSTHTDVGAKAVSYMVRTFKTLATLGDFAADIPAEEELKEESVGKVSKDSSSRKVVAKVQEASGNSLTINVNIQLQIPATEDATIYDKFFESLYKHILSKGDE